MTHRNDVLSALAACLVDALPASRVSRNSVLPDRIPAAGAIVVVRDGEPGEPDVVMSPLSYAWSHRALVEVVVSGAADDGGQAALENVLADMGAALAADRTLGGACDWVQPGGPVIEPVIVEGAQPLLGATVTVVLTYTTADTLA